MLSKFLLVLLTQVACLAFGREGASRRTGSRRAGRQGGRRLVSRVFNFSAGPAALPTEVLEQADEVLPGMVGVTRARGASHYATFSGLEGTVSVSAHRHGHYTDVVASTDRLRTSRLDYEIQKFLNLLPYEPGDRGGPGTGEPT